MIGTDAKVVSKPSRIRKPPMIVRFGRFTLDSGRRLLLDGDRAVTVPPKAFDLLELLIRHAPNVVSKETIADVVWPDEAPSDASLAMAVTELRKALGETGDRPQFIRTVHRRGYAFGGELTREATTVAQAPKFWLVLGEKTVPLTQEETIAGRDPSCAIWLDRPSVSRSHARFIVDGTSAWVEDLGSLNGTVVAGSRIMRRTRLHSGDTVLIGDVTLTVGSSQASATTPTRPLRSV
jgi:DNA-binding winged helix-turn-helix (wHTH) protein